MSFNYWNHFQQFDVTLVEGFDLFKPLREGYFEIKVEKDAINDTIFTHPKFQQYYWSIDRKYERKETADHLTQASGEKIKNPA